MGAVSLLKGIRPQEFGCGGGEGGVRPDDGLRRLRDTTKMNRLGQRVGLQQGARAGRHAVARAPAAAARAHAELESVAQRIRVSDVEEFASAAFARLGL